MPTRFMRPLIFLCALLLPASSKAQKANATNDKNQTSMLKKEILVLQQQQAQVIEQLNALARRIDQLSISPRKSEPPMIVNLHGEVYRGDSAARVAIIEYGDFEYAREVYPQILDNYVRPGKVRYYFRDLPLPMHPHAMLAARAARCAGEAGRFWEMRDNLFRDQFRLTETDLSNRALTLGVDASRFTECLTMGRYTDQIRNNISEAQTIGVVATPTVLLGTLGPNGDDVRIEKTIMGAYPFDTFKAELDRILGRDPEHHQIPVN